jgi:hypothetical protein
MCAFSRPNSPGELLCPKCGYDTFGRAFPSVCPECGLAITEDLLNGLLPWEQSNRGPASHRVGRTALDLLVHPGRAFSRLAQRADVPILHRRRLAGIWLATAALIWLQFSLLVTTYRIADFTYFQPGTAPWQVVTRELSWIGWTLQMLGRDEAVPWILLWIVLASVLGAVLGRRRPVFGFGSALCILGPVMLVSVLVGCIFRFADSVIPITSTLKPILPYVSLILVFGLMLLWGLYVAESVRRTAAKSG